MKNYLSLLVAASLVATFLLVDVHSASAIPAFAKAFKEKYVKADSKAPGDAALAEAVADAKCNVCHKGKKKTDHNIYGEALEELLDKETDKDDVEKMNKVLDQVAKQKSDTADANSPTFGDLLKQGKLPGGDPEQE